MIIRSLLKITFLSTLLAAPALQAWAVNTAPTGTAAVSARVLRVGPTQALRTIAAAAAAARSGDTIEIEPGDYLGDVAVWTQDRLTIRGVRGRARLLANGKSAQGKGIWVVRGGRITVENLVFKDAKVADRNGAGIRFEQGQLTIRNCAFLNNQNGILTAPGSTSELVIENSEFGYNGYGDGQSHGLYVGAIKKLRVSGSYFHHSKVGHLIKSRAGENYILYNRLSDEAGGTASYELEFPNGGAAYVVGNIIEQSPTTSNPAMVAYGMEGYSGRVNELYLSHNTLVDDRPSGGSFLAVRAGAQKLLARNNLLVGKGDLNKRPLTGITQLLLANNLTIERTSLAQPSSYDYPVKDAARSKLATVSAGAASNGFSLQMQRQYVHPASSAALTAPATVVGAVQRPGPVGVGTH